MKDEVKDKNIVVRVTEAEKAMIKEAAKANHFGDNVSAFILWLVRKFGKAQE